MAERFFDCAGLRVRGTNAEATPSACFAQNDRWGEGECERKEAFIEKKMPP